MTILVVLAVIVILVVLVVFNFVKLKLIAWILNKREGRGTSEEMREREVGVAEGSRERQ